MSFLYVDVTNLIKNPEQRTFVQLVEREILNRWIVQEDEARDVVLLAYDDEKNTFRIVNQNAFLDVFWRNKKSFVTLLSEETLSVQDMQEGSVFFDIENVKSNSLKRGFLYPLLKEKQVRIATFIYDLLPVFNPQYCDADTVLETIQFLGAVLQYSNRIITCSQTNIDRLTDLENQLQLPHTDKCLIHIGADFHQDEQLSEEEVSEKIKAIAQTDYIFVPGTIEPKTNHSIILDAIDRGLSEVEVVFCGRYGWQSMTVRKRIEEQTRENPRFHFFQRTNSTELKYLYEHALATVTASLDEAFSLPMIESLQSGTPVIASDIPDFREIGGDLLCYFKPENAQQFIELIRNDILNKESYSRIKDKLTHFTTYQWSESAREIFTAVVTA